MSLIDIEKNKTRGDVGIKKTFAEGSEDLIMDTLQITQYVYPENSIVRELTSNAVDSQQEKEKAIDILTGKAKAEDYYITREDSRYKDSNFDPSYYDLNCLSVKDDKIRLNYIEGSENVGWCDKFVVQDWGVGLGEKRLYGYLQLGFSTKRNTTKLLGGFGFGGKVSLALRGDFFNVETVHNGKRFKLNIYSYKADSLVSKLNLSTGKENNYITFIDGTKIYYEETTDCNQTKVTTLCKRHHKQKFIDAIKLQLLYFKDVDFYIDNELYDFKAKILYNSQHLVISNNYQFSKPHILIDKGDDRTLVSYGYCNFKEMEMQELFSNVGFKCPMRQVIRDKDHKEIVVQEGVSVTPSRESIK